MAKQTKGEPLGTAGWITLGGVAGLLLAGGAQQTPLVGAAVGAVLAYLWLCWRRPWIPCWRKISRSISGTGGKKSSPGLRPGEGNRQPKRSEGWWWRGGVRE